MGKAKKIKVSKKDVVKSSGPLGDQILQGEFAVPTGTGSNLKLKRSGQFFRSNVVDSSLLSRIRIFPSRIRIEEFE
jgi:hypothetical protein